MVTWSVVGSWAKADLSLVGLHKREVVSNVAGRLCAVHVAPSSKE